MERTAASYSREVPLPSLRPIRLVRSFRTDFRPIPTFLQDLLAEAPCHSCSESQGRIVDLLKNIQFHRPLDERSEGKLWFEIRRLLKKGTLANQSLFSDGRAVRNYLMRSIEVHEDTFPLSPDVSSILRLRALTKKLEAPTFPPPVVTLSLTRQISN